MAPFDSKWIAENRCGDWLIVCEDDTYAVAYPDPCRRKDQEAIARLIADAPEIKRLYGELLFAIGNKYPGQNRHETALMYIRNAERPMHAASVKAKSSDEQTPE